MTGDSKRDLATATARSSYVRLEWLVAIFFLLLLLVFSRRPGDLLHAQFYAEDGARWYAQAYNYHWLRSLAIPDASYLQLLPRLFAGVALLLPMHWAPLLLNLGGAVVQVLPCIALLSRRGESWGPLPARFVMVLLYVANPDVREIHVNVTNAQWHFALLQVILAFGAAPKSRLGRAIDVPIFLIGSLSGPFDLVLLPVLFVSWWMKREQWTVVLMSLLLLGSLLQVETILNGHLFGVQQSLNGFSRAEADRIPLGASVHLLVQIVGGNVVLESVFGQSRFEQTSMILPAVFFVFGLIVVGCGLYWGPRGFRYFALYALILFAASLKSPVIGSPVSRWYALTQDQGMRYYFYPTLVFLWAGTYTFFCSRVRWIGIALAACSVLFAHGLLSWRYPSYPDSHFEVYIHQLHDAAPGQTVIVPIYPTPWMMSLVKH